MYFGFVVAFNVGVVVLYIHYNIFAAATTNNANIESKKLKWNKKMKKIKLNIKKYK